MHTSRHIIINNGGKHHEYTWYITAYAVQCLLSKDNCCKYLSRNLFCTIQYFLLSLFVLIVFCCAVQDVRVLNKTKNFFFKEGSMSQQEIYPVLSRSPDSWALMWSRSDECCMTTLSRGLGSSDCLTMLCGMQSVLGSITTAQSRRNTRVMVV